MESLLVRQKPADYMWVDYTYVVYDTCFDICGLQKNACDPSDGLTVTQLNLLHKLRAVRVTDRERRWEE